MKKKFLLFPLFFLFLHASAQDYFPKNDGVSHTNQNFTAFTNATLFVTPTQKIEGGTLLIQNGVVIEAGKNVKIPANTSTINLDGKHIYPSFVDPYSDFGIEKPKRSRGGRSAQYEASRSGYYWNDHIRTEINAFEKFKFDDKKAKELIDAGFGAVSTHHQDGVARGTGMVVTLNNKGNNNERILQQKATQHFSFTRSLEMEQAYPSSVMGSMALLRQMYYDAQWYEGGNATTKDLALEALIANKNLPAIFESKDKLNNLRADKVGDIFNIQYTIVGSGYEYENINEVKATNATYIIPLNFPDAYDVSNPYQASYVSLSDMRKWNQAPQNPKTLAENSIPFAFTTHDIKSPKELKAKIQKAMEYGLSFEKALEALTTVPAQILKNNRIGNLNKNAFANFIITSGPLFEKGTTLYENWVQGQRHEINDMSQKDIRGEYSLTVAGTTYELSISGEPGKPKAEIKQDTLKHKSTLSYNKNWMDLTLTKDDETYRMTGIVNNDSDNLNGRLILPNGNESTFRANKTAPMAEGDENEEEKDKEEKSTPTILPLTYPNMAYGNTSLPQPQDILFKNATVWTGEEAGILEATDVLIKNGKISKIGKNLAAGGARVVDATGKHLTAGIIDEHSHLALSSVNEGGHNSSAEVKMEDVVDPDDIGVYRALAGGVTSAQLLHGSANPIGGRSALVKFKWGETADNMIYQNAPKFIKFALGENVKQSNWGSNSRFPQTRMGVEQVYMDYFQRAKEYEAKKNSGTAFRYDEEMETLVEILNGDRFISCHSYVQSEINMLMKVAEKFNFNVNTFTHILEGYKVAEIMEKHGVVGASTFSDWWGYKFEVNDAIPYNAAIMYNAGLNVSINSDDGEMIRRLNQEAAKAVKYGDVPEYEAWKMVTINPAKMLHIDDRVGSIKEGKDADVVLWNNNPLSMYAKPEKTLIEGAVYFDMEDDILKRNAIKKERNDLIKMMLDEKNGGGKTQSPSKMPQRDFHCETDHLAEGFHSHH